MGDGEIPQELRSLWAMLRDPPEGHPRLAELRSLCREATEDSVLRDLERARGLVKALPSEHRRRGERYVELLEQLERWLHDL